MNKSNRIKELEEQILRLQIKICNEEHAYVMTEQTSFHTASGIRRVTDYQCINCERKHRISKLI